MSESEKDGFEKGAARYCGQCGSSLEGGASFCTQCGASVTAYAVFGPEATDADESADETTVLEGAPEDAADQAGAEPVAISFGAVKPVAAAYVRPSAAGGFGTGKAATKPILQAQPTGAVSPLSQVPGAASPGGSWGGSAGADRDAQRSPKVFAIIAGVVVVLAIAIGVGLGLFGGCAAQDVADDSASAASSASTQASSESSSASSSSAKAAPIDVSVVNLERSHVTQWGQKNKVTYPDFTFRYPAGWSVSSESVSQTAEYVVLANDEGVSVQFGMWMSASTADPVEFVNVEKLADATFKPGLVQGTSYSSLGTFSVVRGDVRVAGHEDAFTCYALAPTRALTDTSVLDMSSGLPGFNYANTVCFTCMPSGSLDARAEQEVVAILASLQVKDAASVPAAAAMQGDYLLPDSSTRLYARSELEPLSDYELYVARNEIFARHGRMFINEDLQKRFGGKSWYSPRYAPEEFDQAMLSDIEKKNAELIQQIEKERGSSYLD